MEHIKRLTISQFKMLRDESLRADQDEKLRFAEAIRVAHHGNKQEFKRWFDRVVGMVMGRKHRKASVHHDDLDRLGDTVKVGKDAS